MNVSPEININAIMRNAFVTPLAEARLPENLQDMLEGFYEEFIPNTLDTRGDNEQYTTYFQKDKNIPLNDKLGEIIKNIGITFMNNLYGKVPNTCNIKIWMQDYTHNQYHSLHMHKGALASGIYVLRSNNQGSPLSLTNPDSTCAFLTSHNECNLSCERGKLYMFPPWLLHYVSPAATNNLVRTVIAFNITEER